MDRVNELLARLITASHILHKYEILDEQGAISVRNPQDPTTFYMSDIAPILLSSRNHFTLFNVADGIPASRTADPVAFDSEHLIHSCIYDRFPAVNSVVHSHCAQAITYSLCNSAGSMLAPTYQMAGFLDDYSPIFDAAKHYAAVPPSHPRDLSITNKHLGEALAETFVNHSLPNGPSPFPTYSLVLCRGHGFVVNGQSIEQSVFRAVHVIRNADIQSAAMVQRTQTELEIVYLSEKEARDSERLLHAAAQRSWRAWAAEVQRSPMYYNDMSRVPA